MKSKTYCVASAAAVSSWVESGLDAHRVTLAPPAWSVRARLAVSVVTCRQAAILRPASGCSFSKRARMSRSTGMCRSAHSMRSRPSSARARLVTSCGKAPPSTANWCIAQTWSDRESARLGPATQNGYPQGRASCGQHIWRRITAYQGTVVVIAAPVGTLTRDQGEKLGISDAFVPTGAATSRQALQDPAGPQVRGADRSPHPRSGAPSVGGDGQQRQHEVPQVGAGALGDLEDLLVGGRGAAAVGDHRDRGNLEAVGAGGDHLG